MDPIGTALLEEIRAYWTTVVSHYEAYLAAQYAAGPDAEAEAVATRQTPSAPGPVGSASGAMD